jgi:hypothetical protein
MVEFCAATPVTSVPWHRIWSRSPTTSCRWDAKRRSLEYPRAGAWPSPNFALPTRYGELPNGWASGQRSPLGRRAPVGVRSARPLGASPLKVPNTGSAQRPRSDAPRRRRRNGQPRIADAHPGWALPMTGRTTKSGPEPPVDSVRDYVSQGRRSTRFVRIGQVDGCADPKAAVRAGSSAVSDE